MPVVTITQPETHKCGSTWTFVLTRTQPDGTPINLAGLTARAMFRAESVDGSVVAELTEGDGIAVDAADGRVVMTIDAATSAAIEPGIWVVFDVEMTDGAGYEWHSKTYRFKTEQQVTR